jgi:phosphinothricin acetyltransferase
MASIASRKSRAERFAAFVRRSGPYRWVGLYDVTPEEVILLGFSGGAPPAHPRFPRGAGLTGAAIARGEAVVSNDVATDPRYLTAFDTTGSELIVPILDERGRVVGTLDVESAGRDAFGPGEVESLSGLSVSVASLFTGISVRTARPADAAAFAEIYAPFTDRTAVSFEEEPPTAEEMCARVRRTLQWTPWLTATNESDVVGYAYASKHRDRAAYRWSVDVSAYVRESFRGRGVGRKLYDELFGILRRQGFRRACAGITLPNDASVALHLAAGFEPVGVYRRIGWKLGAWRDVAWLARDLDPDDAGRPPSEPIPFSSYDDDP